MANVVLALLPVWDLTGNDATMVGALLPTTVLWSYLAFSSNFALAIAYFVVWARPWAEAMQGSQLVQRERADDPQAAGLRTASQVADPKAAAPKRD